MDRTNAFSRLIIGSIAEVAGLMIIIFLSNQEGGRNIPIVVVGALIFMGGALTSVTAAVQLRNLNRP